MNSAAIVLLHRLWTRAVDAPNYVKTDWIALQLEIEQLERRRAERRKQISAAAPPQEARNED